MTTAETASALPDIGALAPDFTLRSTSGSDVTLSSFRGRQNVLIAFFPLAFTSTCTAEVCAFSEDFAQFGSRNTAVLPISVDSVETLREYQAKYQLAVDLLSDFKRTVSRQYGVLNEDRYFANRAYVIVDRTGTVRWRWLEEQNGQRRENNELLSHLAALT